MNDLRGMGAALLVCMTTVLGCGDGTSREELGKVGSHIWFDTSTDIVLTHEWLYERLSANGPPGLSGGDTQSFTRAALSPTQLSGLATLTLIPLDTRCTVDGYSFSELTVADADGSRATCRDTGCPFLTVAGAKAMLSAGGADAALFPR